MIYFDKEKQTNLIQQTELSLETMIIMRRGKTQETFLPSIKHPAWTAN